MAGRTGFTQTPPRTSTRSFDYVITQLRPSSDFHLRDENDTRYSLLGRKCIYAFTHLFVQGMFTAGYSLWALGKYTAHGNDDYMEEGEELGHPDGPGGYSWSPGATPLRTDGGQQPQSLRDHQKDHASEESPSNASLGFLPMGDKCFLPMGDKSPGARGRLGINQQGVAGIRIGRPLRR